MTRCANRGFRLPCSHIPRQSGTRHSAATQSEGYNHFVHCFPHVIIPIDYVWL
ncbi:Uncharacterised protein [Vibrio cholerae]|nr:Uncharacterised protein [Vibrio cholerae]